MCPHRAHEFVKPNSQGTLNSKVFTCPNHAWSFKAATGELVKARFSEEFASFCKSDYTLKKVTIKEMAGLLFVNMAISVNLEESFGPDLKNVLREKIPAIDSPAMQQIALTKTVINANWKMLVDNFLECYHCDIAHKDFVDMVDLSRIPPI